MSRPGAVPLVRSIAVLSVAAALAVLAIAGCGGGSTTALTKDSFLKQGEEICFEKGAEIQLEAEQFNRERGIGQHEDPPVGVLESINRTVVVPHLRQEAKLLSELETPSGEKEKIEAIVARLKRGVEEAEETLGGSPGTGLIKATIVAREFGLGGCGLPLPQELLERLGENLDGQS